MSNIKNYNKSNSKHRRNFKSNEFYKHIAIFTGIVNVILIITIIAAILAIFMNDETDIKTLQYPSVVNIEQMTVNFNDNKTPIKDQLPRYIVDDYTSWESQIGNNTININSTKMIRKDLPNKYYYGLDFSTFQPYMCYTKITNTGAPAYAIVNSENCYTDELGMRRYKTNSTQFTVNGEDDYVIALGTYYKEKGVVGNRYLVVTTTGMYTAITGDEKADIHTDDMNMFSIHGDNQAGVIEWIVDWNNLNSEMRKTGTVTIGGPEVAMGEILHIYEIK